MAKETRKRNYACVIYPESAPENWQELLASAKVPAFASPLHDMDIDPGGHPKKPHHHVMVMFEGLKSEAQVKEIFDAIGGVGLEVVNSIRSYARYMCHLDNPDKAQYDPDTVLKFSGADYISIIGLASDKYKAIEEMMDYCRENSLFSYARLMEYAAVNRRDWFRSLCDNSSYVMREYLKSLRWENEEDMESQPSDGEAAAAMMRTAAQFHQLLRDPPPF